MEYLFDSWDKLKEEIASKYIMLFLDYDGTLASIVETPEKAKISRETKGLLDKFSGVSDCRLAIISGRSVTDIKNKVGLKNIIYAGNHGLEIDGPKIKFTSQVPPGFKINIRHIYENMTKQLSDIKGVLIEDKGLTISVHYRLVNEKDMPALKDIVNEITYPYVAKGKIKINPGKKVYEIKPPTEWNKGKVVLWLLARQEFLQKENNIFPIYIGDDIADEDAFKVLKDKGLTVFVGGPKKSEARFYLNDVKEVAKFVGQIIELKEPHICRN